MKQQKTISSAPVPATGNQNEQWKGSLGLLEWCECVRGRWRGRRERVSVYDKDVENNTNANFFFVFMSAGQAISDVLGWVRSLGNECIE